MVSVAVVVRVAASVAFQAAFMPVYPYKNYAGLKGVKVSLGSNCTCHHI